MRIHLHLPDATIRECHRAHVTADCVTPTGACPQCRAEPFSVSGAAPRMEHRTATAKAVCRQCATEIGVLVVTIPTLFGLEQDAEVLHGRWRVY